MPSSSSGEYPLPKSSPSGQNMLKFNITQHTNDLRKDQLKSSREKKLENNRSILEKNTKAKKTKQQEEQAEMMRRYKAAASKLTTYENGIRQKYAKAKACLREGICPHAQLIEYKTLLEKLDKDIKQDPTSNLFIVIYKQPNKILTKNAYSRAYEMRRRN